MKELHIDIESYSSADLGKCGVYKYAEAEDFEILLFAYYEDGKEVKVVDLAKGKKIPQRIIKALEDDSVRKWSFNAQFERVCLSRFLGHPLSPRAWHCSMVWSAYQTELDNPNSVTQMKQWLADNGMETDSLGKKVVAELLKTAPEPLRTVLTLRQQLSKSSVKKYTAMDNAVCADGRCRGMFMFYGANRSGRFSGRIIQLQNLYRNSMADLDEARAIVRSDDTVALELLYDSIPDVLSELVRTAFIPAEGMKFIVADFSSIEARVLSYLAGEQWRLDVFREGGDIYCATASRMFGVPVEKHGMNGELRQKGKQADLACGYGGGVGAMKAMGALELGIAEDELDGIVKAWRSASPKTVRMWWDVDRAVKEAVKEKTTTATHGLTFTYQSAMLFITLPSGRRLAYVKPRIGENKFGGESVTYMGIGATKKWERIKRDSV